jgi:hypothetical protein
VLFKNRLNPQGSGGFFMGAKKFGAENFSKILSFLRSKKPFESAKK